MQYRKSLIGDYFAIFLLDEDGNDLNKEPFNVQITEDLDGETLDMKVAAFAVQFAGEFESPEAAQEAIDQAERDRQVMIAAVVERVGNNGVHEIPPETLQSVEGLQEQLQET